MSVFVAKDEGLLVAALRQGTVPEAISAAPVQWVRRPDGLGLDLPTTPSPSERAALIRAGFRPQRSGLSETSSASCWAEVARCVRAPDPELPIAEALFLVPFERTAEATRLLLGLGCNDLEMMSFATSSHERRTAIRAVAPPYYALLRLERAYLQTSPRVWVRMGWEHPLSDALRPPDHHHILVDPDENWLPLEDGPWATLREQIDLDAPLRHNTQHLDPPRLEVQLRLTRHSAQHPPALWVLREEAASQLDALVASTPSAALDDLQFAVVQTQHEPCVLLRRRRGARTPASLSFQRAQAYVAHPRLERVHVPARTEVSPPLRTDQLARALCDNNDDIVWLVPEDDTVPTSFSVRSVPETAFVSLGRWVDYVASRHREALCEWMDNAVFEFEPFTRSRDALPQAPTSAERTPRQRRRPSPAPQAPDEPRVAATAPRLSPAPRPLVAPEFPHTNVHVTQLEQALLDDLMLARDPEHWVALAQRYGATGRAREGSLAWAHALSLVPDAARTDLSRQAIQGFDATESQRLVAKPSAHQAAQVVLHALALQSVPSAVAGWIRTHDTVLDTRSYWAFWDRWSAATHDPLARAHATDAVLGRLRGGLAPRDLPAFIRADGSGQDELTVDALAGALEELRSAVRSTPRAKSPVEAVEGLTHCYTELAFAWGFARLGRDDACAAAVEASERAFESALADPGDVVHHHARASYRERITQARDGMHLHAPLSIERRRELDAMPKMERYTLDRLRQASLILDTSADLDPFARFSATSTPALPPDARPESLARALETRLAGDPLGDEGVFEVMRWATLLPPHLTSPRLEALRIACTRLPVDRRARPLEVLLRLASVCDRDDEVRETYGALHPVLADQAASASRALGRLASLLRKHGLANAAATQIRGALDNKTLAKTEQLELVSALAPLGDVSPLLEATPQALAGIEPARTPQAERLAVARVLMRGLGQASTGQAIAAAKRLAQDSLPHVTDALNTNTHFCRALIHLVETWVVSLARPDALLSRRARDFVDEQEHQLRHHLFALP